MKTAILKDVNLDKVADISVKILKQGGLLVSPSDTVYGLLVDATNQKAVNKLINFKNRPRGQPISVFVADFFQLQKQVKVSKDQLQTLRQLLPGPFTLILASKHQVSPLLESEHGTLGVRIPDYRFINLLVKKFGRPITATSANLSGRSVHYSISSFLNTLPEKKKRLIDLVIDGGVLPRNKPSTVVDLTTPKLKLIRGGDIIFNEEKKYISKSPSQTKNVSQFILKKILEKQFNKPLVFILEGDLGVGKTVFVKGIGEFLGIKNIISPTFVVYYEYEIIKSKLNKLLHIDLYNIQDSEEFKYLGLERYFKRGNLLCFEWGEKAGEIMDLLRRKGKIIYVKMNYINEKEREIEIKF